MRATMMYARRQAGARQGARIFVFQGDIRVTVQSPRSAHGLDKQGIDVPAELHWNLGTAPLVEMAVKRGEGVLA